MYFVFLVLSLTWGLPLTLAGMIVSLALRLSGRKARRFGWCRYFEVGREWGGCEFGPVFLKERGESLYLCEHEFGHALQNCIYGPLMPFLVTIPSAVRYWYRRIVLKHGGTLQRGYYDIWFESQASRLGRKYYERMMQDRR